MFTKEERKQIDRITELGLVDAFRKFHKKDGYTWWLRAFNAKERNIGWRIDYAFLSKQLEPYLQDAFADLLHFFGNQYARLHVVTTKRQFINKL